MAKIAQFDFRGVPEEVTDFKDKITSLVNFGKYQLAVTDGAIDWVGRQGEFVWHKYTVPIPSC